MKILMSLSHCSRHVFLNTTVYYDTVKNVFDDFVYFTFQFKFKHKNPHKSSKKDYPQLRNIKLCNSKTSFQLGRQQNEVKRLNYQTRNYVTFFRRTFGQVSLAMWYKQL